MLNFDEYPEKDGLQPLFFKQFMSMCFLDLKIQSKAQNPQNSFVETGSIINGKYCTCKWIT